MSLSGNISGNRSEAAALPRNDPCVVILFSAQIISARVTLSFIIKLDNPVECFAAAPTVDVDAITTSDLTSGTPVLTAAADVAAAVAAAPVIHTVSDAGGTVDADEFSDATAVDSASKTNIS
jgi:hypothetical protein